MRYHTILFDLDGTLTDSGPGITNSVRYALEKFGICERDQAKLDRFVGPPLADAFARYYHFPPADCERAVEYYREYFRDRGIFENSVYPGIPELLAALKQEGCTVLLATCKPRVFAVRILEHFDLIRYFDGVAGTELSGLHTGKAEVIAAALAQAGIREKSACVMVGDRENDIAGAAAEGISAIGVLYGYGEREELTAAGAVTLAESTAKLAALLLEK